MCVALAAAVAGLAAAATVIQETSPGVNGQAVTYDVTDGVYAAAAADFHIESDYTTSTDGSSTTFTFLVRHRRRLPFESCWHR